MEHLACNVYCWGARASERLLAECLAPAVRALRASGLAERFWFQRFDARGPHLFVLLGTAPGRADALREALGARLRAWMDANPSTETLPDDDLRVRHANCRGKCLCAVDAEPGFAPNNTVRWARQPPGGYPFNTAEGLARPDPFWDLASDLCEWSLSRLGDGTGAAIRWTAAVDAELRRAHPDAADAWRYYACTLLLGLDERLARDEAAVLDALPGIVGARNAAVFARVWDAVEGGEVVWEPLPELLRMVFADDGRTMEQRMGLLREVNHTVLAQLGLMVTSKLPLILFAWMRGLAPAPAVG